MLATTFQHNGFTVEIHYDEDGTYANPRDADNNGLFLGFPHRNYSIGDQQVDPGGWATDCAGCKGEGAVAFDIMGEEVERTCPRCKGDGELYVRSFEDAVAYVRANYGAVGPVLPVSLYDHGNVSYRVGFPSDPWDSGNAGLIFATRETLDLGHGKGVTPSDEDLTRWLTGEIDEYSKWASGEVYGFVIKDRNGDTVESSWGYLGDEYVQEAAKEACPPEDTQPILHTLRLSARTLDVIEAALQEAIDTSLEDEAGEAERALEIVRGAREGGDPEGMDQWGSPVTLTAYPPLARAGQRATFVLTPAERKDFASRGWLPAPSATAEPPF